MSNAASPLPEQRQPVDMQQRGRASPQGRTSIDVQVLTPSLPFDRKLIPISADLPCITKMPLSLGTMAYSPYDAPTGVASESSDPIGMIAESERLTDVAEMRYKADITAGALKVPESRVIADLLLRGVDAEGWKDAIVKRNVLQARSPATASRLTKLVRGRLQTMGPDLWCLIRDGKGTVATHAVLAAAVKHSPLLGDFLDLVVREQYRLFAKTLASKLWDEYLDGCQERDLEMPQWHDSTGKRLRSSVFQTLAQAGYVENTRSLKLQTVHIAEQVLHYLKDQGEEYVLRCIQVAP